MINIRKTNLNNNLVTSKKIIHINQDSPLKNRTYSQITNKGEKLHFFETS
jgi:hypothetical protein